MSLLTIVDGLMLQSPMDNTSSIFIKEFLLSELFAVASSQAFAAASAISLCLISSGDGPSSILLPNQDKTCNSPL